MHMQDLQPPVSTLALWDSFTIGRSAPLGTPEVCPKLGRSPWEQKASWWRCQGCCGCCCPCWRNVPLKVTPLCTLGNISSSSKATTVPGTSVMQFFPPSESPQRTGHDKVTQRRCLQRSCFVSYLLLLPLGFPTPWHMSSLLCAQPRLVHGWSHLLPSTGLPT